MAFQASHRFAELRQLRPDLSDTQLLNSNNRTPFSGKADVVVAGAGMLGLCYAIHLKNISPRLKIEVFEKSPEPVQKIGESTLSPFSKFVSGEVVPHDLFLRLFGLKDGLHFYCVDKDGQSVTCSDVGGLDISYQLDRRVSELFFTMWAQSIGINVYHGVGVDFDVLPIKSSPSFLSRLGQGLISRNPSKPFNTPKVTLSDASNAIGPQIDAQMVCDASGFSRRLTSKFGSREKFDGGWNCNAYWAYFKEKNAHKVDSRLQQWNYPATKHVCFPEGWGWFIGLISWHHASLSNLMDLIASLIDSTERKVPVAAVPCTQALSKMFDCPFEFITSIGWAVRNDYTLPEDLSAYGSSEGEQKFNYFQRKYPVLESLMDGSYELLPKYYGDKTYYAKKSLAYRSPVVAGEGWFAIGNSSGFTNPLISPGINAGLGGAWTAAELTHHILATPAASARTVMVASAHVYQSFIHETAMPRLHQMNRLWYNAFRDHRLFGAITRCIWPSASDNVGDHYSRTHYNVRDAQWLVGAGMDLFQDFCRDVLAVLEPGTGGAPPTKDQVDQVQELSDEYAARCVALHPENRWGRWLRQYDDNLQLIPGKVSRDAGHLVSAYRCRRCNYFVHNRASACPICGDRSILT